jgi:hypothetical protein
MAAPGTARSRALRVRYAVLPADTQSLLAFSALLEYLESESCCRPACLLLLRQPGAAPQVRVPPHRASRESHRGGWICNTNDMTCARIETAPLRGDRCASLLNDQVGASTGRRRRASSVRRMVYATGHACKSGVFIGSPPARGNPEASAPVALLHARRGWRRPWLSRRSAS